MYKQVKGWWKHLDFILIDFLGLHLSFLLAYWFRMGMKNPYRDPIYQDLVFLVSAFFLVIVLLDKNYSGILRRSFFQETVAVVRMNVLLLALILIYLFAIHTTETYSRIQMSTFILINTFTSLVLRLINKKSRQKQGV